jgi:hypothetical protein
MALNETDVHVGLKFYWRTNGKGRRRLMVVEQILEPMEHRNAETQVIARTVGTHTDGGLRFIKLKALCERGEHPNG